MAHPVDLVIEARWIVPIEPRGAVYENHALAVHQGRIVALCPIEEARIRFQAAQQVMCPRHALMPGLVNAHTHAAMSLLRGYADDLPLMQWLQGHIWPAEQRWVSEDFVYDGSELAIAEMLLGGITCCNDMYFYPEITARAARRAGMRACVGLIVLDFPSAWAQHADQYIEKGLALHDELRGDTLIQTALAPHAPYSVGDAALQRVRVLADELDLKIHMHVHETAEEVADGITRDGLRPLQRLERLGLLSSQLTAVHMTQLDDGEIERLAASGTQVVHCPESNLKLASGFCPVARLIDAGVNVALGTDGAASNNDLDLWGEMRTAALLAKAVAADARAVPAAQALALATLNGARALGLEHEIGSLAPGKAADVIAVDLGMLWCQPCYDPCSQLVYAAGRECVTDVWVAGRQVVRDRTLTTLDAQAIGARARRWQASITASRAVPA